MARKLECERGSASISFVIIIACLVVFLIIPLSAFVFDKLKVNLIAREVGAAIDVAIEDGYHSLQKPILSQEDFTVDGPILEYYVSESLKRSLSLNDDFSPKAISKLDGPLSIELLKFIGTADLPYTEVATGTVYNKPFVEIKFTIRLKPTLYQDIILNALGKSYVEYQSKRKSIIHVNN